MFPIKPALADSLSNGRGKLVNISNTIQSMSKFIQRRYTPLHFPKGPQGWVRGGNEPLYPETPTVSTSRKF
jgi:hypothetical protein